MSSTVPAHRPFGVSLLSLLFMIVGVLEVIGGIVVLFQRNDDDFLAGVDVSSGDLAVYAIVSIVFGLVVVAIGSALRNGANWARFFVAIIAVLRLGALIWIVIAYHNVHWYNAFWPVVLYALVAGYLFYDGDAVEYFERT